MNFPFYIARRYVFARKSHNAINLIAIISIIGIAFGTAAFITLLSVFNGFDGVVRSMFNSFYADIEVVPKEGKVFVLPDSLHAALKDMPEIANFSQIVEENTLIIYGSRQTIGTVRGVDDRYADVTGIDTMMGDGQFMLYKNDQPVAILGRGIKYMLNAEPEFRESLKLIVPQRTERISFNQERATNRKYIRPAGHFKSQPEIEVKYMLVPLDFARELFDYSNETSAVEIRLQPDVNANKARRKLEDLFGKDYRVKNRIMQNELLYKTMKSEKWAIFFILSFILLVASFNVVGSLTMLIIEKKNDIQTLRHLGANLRTIKKTFLIEGLIIAFFGALSGLFIGSLICWAQQTYGIVRLQGAESFVIDAYPVKLMLKDVFLVLIVVSTIGYIASWYPIRFITRKYLTLQEL